MSDFFWYYIIWYLLPPLTLLAVSAPEIQIYPKLVAYSTPNLAQRWYVITWMSVGDAIVYAVQCLLFGERIWFMVSALVWGLLYLVFAWRVGPYLDIRPDTD